MKRSSTLFGIAMSVLITCPALAFETTPFNGDVHAYGPIHDWTGHEAWIKAPLGWTGQEVWIK